MKLKDLKSLFLERLTPIYQPDESQKLFAIFCETILGLEKIRIHSVLGEEIDSELQHRFLEALAQLEQGKPYQQIIGEVYFYGNRFFIDENVLIPRPETEELVEIISQKLKDKKTEKIKILDIGSGSGCIPISLAKIFPNALITSIDISEKALEIAKKNAIHNQVKINFIQKDYLNEDLDEVYDIIVSNPPYIGVEEQSEIALMVKDYEPNIALFAPENDVLAFYRKITRDVSNHLNEGGWVFLEINQKLGAETLALFEGLKEKTLVKDLSGNERFVIGKK